MKVKRFQATSYRDALAQVKSDLGPDAVILTTRQVNRGRWFGLVRRPSIEIVAATDIRLSDAGQNRRGRLPSIGAPVTLRGSQRGAAPSPPARTARPEPGRPEAAEVATPSEATTDARLAQLERHLGDMRTALNLMARRQERPEPYQSLDIPFEFASVYHKLRDADVRRELAAQLLRSVSEEASGEVFEDPVPFVWRAIANRLRTAGPIEPDENRARVVALIGPTGVGKTTTIAKLAASFTFSRDRRVGLLTVDTYRVAAIEQLRTFAEIMTVPVVVASTPEEAGESLGKFSPRPELILVDTAGRSQRNADQIDALNKLIEAIEPDEIHLVLSATTKTRDLSDVARRFGRLGADRLIFTKLDETTSLGPILNIAVETGLPLSYVTCGQMVPEDLEVADSESLARLILVGSENGA